MATSRTHGLVSPKRHKFHRVLPTYRQCHHANLRIQFDFSLVFNFRHRRGTVEGRFVIFIDPLLNQVVWLFAVDDLGNRFESFLCSFFFSKWLSSLLKWVMGRYCRKQLVIAHFYLSVFCYSVTEFLMGDVEQGSINMGFPSSKVSLVGHLSLFLLYSV